MDKCLFCESSCVCINPVTNQKDLRPHIEAKIRNLELNIKHNTYPYSETEKKNPKAEIERLKVRLGECD